YDYYNYSFKLDNFNKLINFTYLSQNGRINERSQIGVLPKSEFEWPILGFEVYINYSDNIDYLTNISYNELYSNYWVIYLDSLSDWILDKGLTPNEYDVNFILKANLTYGPEFPYYTVNYTLPPVTLDIKGPDMTLLSGGSYSLTLESVYDNVLENIITMAINSTDLYFDSVKLQYKYNTPTTADWITYNSYDVNNYSLASIEWDIINFRDDNITFRFVGYDDLNNEKVLEVSNYWIVKDFNNHLQFVVEGIESSQIYSLESDKTIDLDVKIIPVDNDITRIRISTSYESFDLTTVLSDQNHIYFVDNGGQDIRLNSTFYNIFGSEFIFIPIEIKLFQGTTIISSEQIVISVIAETFDVPVNISGLSVDILTSLNNIWMSFDNYKNAYNNSHSLPYIPNNSPPVLKVFNSYNDLVRVIPLYPFLDATDTEIYNILTVNITNNRFIIPIPNPVSGEFCSIEAVYVNGTSFEFSYFFNNRSSELLITLLTEVNLDGSYNASAPISIDYGISMGMKTSNQFVGSYDFSLLSQDNYTVIGEFYDILGSISTFTLPEIFSIDYDAPEIFPQFIPINHSVNPESGSISFILRDHSGVSSYSFNISILGYWSVVADTYTFYFNDASIPEGLTYISFIYNDTLGYGYEYNISLIFDRTPPVFTNLQFNNNIISNLFEINITIIDISAYNLDLELIHISTGTSYNSIEYTITEILPDTWRITFDSSQLPNGYYDIKLKSNDFVGNYNSTTIQNIYIDNEYPQIVAIDEQIYVDGENIFNNTIYNDLYFNDEEYISIEAFDQLYDNFDWSSIDPTIALQLGLKNITFFYTNYLDWYNISISGNLNYEQLIYQITGYGDPKNFNIQNIMGIQQLRIANYSVDEFTIILDGTSILIKISERYRYLLSPQYTDQIEAQFYEFNSNNSKVLDFNPTTNRWDLTTSGLNYFNISEYLLLTEGQQFLWWLTAEDGLANRLNSHKITGIYDNFIGQTPQGQDMFQWHLGTNSTGSG
ncbi:hypothetical protein LCGC14_1700530, partial [marine sediment metagenome]